MEPASERKALRWQRGVIYQVYPRSFQDSNAVHRSDQHVGRGSLAESSYIGAGRVVFSTDMKRTGQLDLADTHLGPDEGIVVRLEGTTAACCPNLCYCSVHEPFGHRSVVWPRS